MAKCKACQNQNSGIYGLGDVNITIIAAAAAGALVSKKVAPMVLDRVEFLATNPLLKSGIKIGLGVVLAGMEGDAVQGLGIGMAADAAGELIGQYLPMGDAAVTGVPSSSAIAPQNQYSLGTRPTFNIGAQNSMAKMDWQDSMPDTIGQQKMHKAPKMEVEIV